MYFVTVAFWADVEVAAIPKATTTAAKFIERVTLIALIGWLLCVQLGTSDIAPSA
jgi:hypothetical protein